jgi:acyl-CoA reductase-like NAD-dependent aldehyde dehydrogenase
MQVREHAFIGGRWRRITGDLVFEVINPATGEPVTRVKLCGDAEATAAIAAAKEAYSGWSA